jgi:hypothetical protein
MQIGDRAVTAHQQPTPDHWADLANPDMEPENFDTGFVDHHGLSLANGCQNCYSIIPASRLLHSPRQQNRNRTDYLLQVRTHYMLTTMHEIIVLK